MTSPHGPAFFNRLARAITARPKTWLVAFAILVATLGSGALKLQVDFSARAYFGREGEASAALDRFHATFGPDDNAIFIVLEAAPEQLLSPAGLAQIDAVSSRIAEVDGVDDVVSITRTEIPQRQDDALVFAPPTKYAPKAPTPLALAGFRARLTTDRNISPALLAKDGSATLIAATYGRSINGDDIDEVRALLTRIEAALSTTMLKTGLAGLSVVRARLLKLILGDQFTLVPLSFLVLAILLFLLYGRFLGVALPLAAAALPSLVVMGVMGFRGEPIGVVNQVYFTLLPVIAVSGAVHLMSRYYDEANKVGHDAETLIPHDRENVVVGTVGHVGSAIFFASLTTIVGLFSLQLSEMPVLRGFGFYSGIGVGFAFLTIVVLLPALLSITRGRVLDPQKAAKESAINGFLLRAANLSLARPRLFVSAAVVVLLVCIAVGQNVILDNTVSGLLADDHPATLSGEVIDEKLGGLVSLEVHLKGPPGVFTHPETLRVVRQLEEIAADAEAVRTVQGPAGFISEMNYAVVGERDIPETSAIVVQLLFLADGRPELASVLNGKRDEARLSIRARDVGGQGFIALKKALGTSFQGPMQSLSPDHRFDVEFTGTPLAAYIGINTLARDLRKSVFLALLIIILIISLLFRSLRVGFISVLPNILPLAVGYASLAVLSWPLEPGPAVVFTIALGIAVDDTIHMLVRIDEFRDAGHKLKDAIAQAVVHSGRPVIITTIILTAGFGVNMASSFPTNSRVGALGALVILTALFADVFVLPPLVYLFARRDDDEIDGTAAKN